MRETTASEDGDTKSQLELFSQTATVVALICYVVGLVTVNAWLFQLGISEFSAINPRFIYTGAVMLALIAATVLLYLGAARAVVSRKPLGVLLALLPPIGFGFLLGTQHPPGQPTGVVIREAAVVSLSLAALLAVSAAAWIHFTQPTGSTHGVRRLVGRMVKHVPTAPGRAAAFALLLLATMGVSTTLLGQYVYPEIPDQFGGGQARTAKFAITSDAVADLAQLGIEVDEDTHVTEPMYVLFETSDAYVIRIGDRDRSRGNFGRVALIDKDYVEGVGFAKFLR